MASDQVVQRRVRDQRQVVQLQHRQVFRGARGRAQLSDALIGDQLAMGQGQGLQPRATSRQGRYRRVRDQQTLLQIHPLQVMAIPGQGLYMWI